MIILLSATSLKRARKIVLPDLTTWTKPADDHTYSIQENTSLESPSKNIALQTDLTGNDMEELIKENQRLKATLANKEKLQRDIFMNNVFKSDVNVNRYTSVVNEAVYRGLFDFIKSTSEWKDFPFSEENQSGNPGPSRKLSNFEEFTLTMIRLRTGMRASIIADNFGISNSRVSQIFCTWITFLSSIFKPLIKWPSKKKVQKHMPKSFKQKYPQTRAVIDCTEFFLQKPYNTKAQATTYSTYKSRNTANCLVAVDPTGAFTFISATWGGNVSDRFITEKSGFLDLVGERDDIMADRGFTITDLLLNKKATLNMPHFTRKCTFGNKKKLNVKEIQQTRQIAKLRIHVERAIGRLKNFSMLSNQIPLNCHHVLDHAIVVAAFLCNLLPPLVTK